MFVEIVTTPLAQSHGYSVLSSGDRFGELPASLAKFLHVPHPSNLAEQMKVPEKKSLYSG